MMFQRSWLLAVLLVSLIPNFSAAYPGDAYVLAGTIVTPNEVIPEGRVLVEGDKIKEVGTNVTMPAGAAIVRVDGIILPGMIDLHDHLVWNVFPRWKPSVLFRDRYEWQETDAYAAALKNPEGDLIKVGLGCEMERYAEIKALVGGATSKQGVGLVWSPRSNIELYGTTLDAGAAKGAGIRIALAPDWSPSGSSGMLNELRYANQWNGWQTPPVFDEKELVRMGTIVPAELANVEDKIGSIAPQREADLLVLRSRPESPYHAIVQASPADVKLVIVGGEPLYGDPALMSKLLPGRTLEVRQVCGEQRAFNLAGQGSGESLAMTEQTLAPALHAHNSSLAPLQECP